MAGGFRAAVRGQDPGIRGIPGNPGNPGVRPFLRVLGGGLFKNTLWIGLDWIGWIGLVGLDWIGWIGLVGLDWLD